jgi:hypothetical protein
MDTLQRIIFGDKLIALHYSTIRFYVDRFGNDPTSQSFTTVFFFWLADLPKDVMKISGDRELNVSLYRHWTLFKVITRLKISLNSEKNVQIMAHKRFLNPITLRLVSPDSATGKL